MCFVAFMLEMVEDVVIVGWNCVFFPLSDDVWYGTYDLIWALRADSLRRDINVLKQLIYFENLNCPRRLGLI